MIKLTLRRIGILMCASIVLVIVAAIAIPWTEDCELEELPSLLMTGKRSVCKVNLIRTYQVETGNSTVISEDARALDIIREYLEKSGFNRERYTVYFYTENACEGEIVKPTGEILISGCKRGTVIRNTVLTPEVWIGYVLFHEIGHAELWTSDQCEADEFAHNEMKKLGYEIEKLGECEEVL